MKSGFEPFINGLKPLNTVKQVWLGSSCTIGRGAQVRTFAISAGSRGTTRVGHGGLTGDVSDEQACQCVAWYPSTQRYRERCVSSIISEMGEFAHSVKHHVGINSIHG